MSCQSKAPLLFESESNPSSNPHPLDPLSASEILLTSTLIRTHATTLPVPLSRLLFNSITLKEPAKLAVLKWSGSVGGEEVEGCLEEIKRQADVHCLDSKTARGYEIIVNLPSNLGYEDVTKPSIVSWVELDSSTQPSLQVEELLWAEEICRKDAGVVGAVREVGVEPEDLYVDGWCIGHDERFPETRLQQCFLFTKSKGREGDNLYAHPLDMIVVINSYTGEVLAIDYPHINGATAPSSATAHAALPTRERITPPSAPHNYLHSELLLDDPSFTPREGLKPIHITQPEGVSFEMEGRVIKWQNWSIHIGFNYREGLVLSDISYMDQGVKRGVVYRMSVAEMVVPYAKTTFPHHRKSAFDLGEYGIGALANSLELGRCCLGAIQYLDFDMCNQKGEVETIQRAICIHEEDAGLLHKHTDFRSNKSWSVRNRKLVISSICTVANYEYGFYFEFDLAGSVEVVTKLTGIVNAYVLGEGEERDDAHEVRMSPRIAAQHHQHLFSLRVDPMIDGLNSQVLQVDAVPDPAPPGSDLNFYGNGFRSQKTLYKTAKESAADYDSRTSRSWVIENPGKQNRMNGANVGYKLVCHNMPPMLAQPGSMVWNRSPFARHNMFVTPYHPDEIYPSGIHINQHPGGELFGLAEWVERDEPIVDKDIVLWVGYGVTHFSRLEDWPIMPVETLRVHLKPANFFERNPGLDVPNERNGMSRLVRGVEQVGSSGGSESSLGTSGSSCCRE